MATYKLNEAEKDRLDSRYGDYLHSPARSIERKDAKMLLGHYLVGMEHGGIRAAAEHLEVGYQVLVRIMTYYRRMNSKGYGRHLTY